MAVRHPSHTSTATWRLIDKPIRREVEQAIKAGRAAARAREKAEKSRRKIETRQERILTRRGKRLGLE
jgi:hypothetical protein